MGKRKTKKTPAKATVTELQVGFKNASPTKTRRNLGVEMTRDELALSTVDAMFVNSQLSCVIRCDPNGDKDAAGQQTFEEDALELEFIADVSNVTITADSYRFTLSLPLDVVDVHDVERFRYRKGKLLCSRVGQADLPAGEAEE